MNVGTAACSIELVVWTVSRQAVSAMLIMLLHPALASAGRGEPEWGRGRILVAHA